MAGRWYLALSIVMGVVAILAGNNVLYLLESFLLGGLILSGIVSERSIASVEVRWHRGPAVAGRPCGDPIEVVNTSRAPLFCVEVGVWCDGRFEPMVFVPYLGPRERKKFISQKVYAQRGLTRWDGIGCATRAPFGFARKLRWIPQPGARLVWPAPVPRDARAKLFSGGSGHPSQSRSEAVESRPRAHSSKGGGSVVDGEVRQAQAGDDFRDVVWFLSVMRGEPMVRVRRESQTQARVTLDLRRVPGPEFERAVSVASTPFHAGLMPYAGEGEAAAELVLIDLKGRSLIQGAQAALDALSEVRANAA